MKKKKSNVAKKIGFGMLMVGSMTLSAGTSISELGKELSVNSFTVKKIRAEEEGGTSGHEVVKTNLYFDDDTASVDKSDTHGYKWDKTTKTLTLSGFNMVTGMCPALELPTGSTIYLEKNTENTITLEDHAITQDTTGGHDLGAARATAGIYVGDGTSNSTVNIVGYGSLNTTVGHMDDVMVAAGTADYKIRYTFGVCGNIVVGNEAGTDSPKVDIIVTDDVLNFTLNKQTYTTGIQVLRRSCGFTLNNGNLHMKAGKANIGAVLFLASTMVYNKGKIVLEISKDANTSFICYGAKTEITNSKKLPITVKDDEGNDLTFNSTAGVYSSANGKAYYVIIDISKQIILESKSGGMQVGKAGEVTLDYSTANLEDGDTVGIEYYDPSLEKYTTDLPEGMSKEIDTTNKKIKLITEGKAPEGTYQFRLVLTASSTYDYQTFYSSDFNFIVGFEPTGNEYDSGDHKLEESDNPEKTNEAITITASDGYQVSSDGENYSDTATFDEESTKKNPKVHASLFIKREEDGSVSTVEFDYSLDTTSPTAKFNDDTSYVTPDNETSVNEDVALTLSDVEDTLSETANIKKEYVVLSTKYSEEDLKKQDAAGSITWTTLEYDEKEGKGNITVSGKDGETKVAYVKITDEAGNITYFASDAYSFDMTAPTITGLEDDGEYYTSTGFTVSDDVSSVYYYKNDESSSKVLLQADEYGNYILPGNEEATYNVVVEDKAGNKTSINVSTHAISSLGDSIKDLTVDNVKTTDLATIQAVQEEVAAIDTTNATESEIAALKAISNSTTGEEGKCETLIAKINDINAEYVAIEKINSDYQKETITSDNLEALTAIQTSAASLLSSENLTTQEKTAIQADYDLATEYINSLKSIATSIKDIKDGIDGKTTANVTSEDKAKLTTLLSSAETLLAGSNLTTEERNTVTEYQTTIKALLGQIATVDNDITTLSEYLEKHTTSNVTDDDSAKINELISTADELLNGDNLTEAETTAVTGYKKSLQDLLSKISDVKDDISSIASALKDKDSDNIKSSDEKTISDAYDKIDALLEGDNLTSVQRNELLAYQATAEELLNKISSVASEIKSIEETIDSFDISTVNSSNKATIEAQVSKIDALLAGDNLTASEKTELEEYKDKANLLLSQIDKNEELQRIQTEANKYSEETVKSSDKSAINKLISDIDAASSEYASLLSEAEKSTLAATKKTLQGYLTKLDDVASDISDVEGAIEGKTTANVKSSDKASLKEAQDTANALLAGDNLTAEERTSLTETNSTITELLSKIADVEGDIADVGEALKGKTAENVTSDDKPPLEAAQETVKSLLDSENLTSDEISSLTEKKETIETLLNKISSVANDIKTVEEKIDSFDKETVTSSDKAEITKAIEDANALVGSSNLTSAEKAELNTYIEKANSLLDEISKDEAIAKVNEAASKYSESTVKSSDKDDIKEIITDIDAILTDYKDNLSEAEISSLNSTKETLNGYLSKIQGVSDSLADISSAIEGKTTANVKSSDKSSLEAAKDTANALLAGDNLTAEERASLTETNSAITELLSKIAEVEDGIAEVDEALKGKTAENVTSDDKSSLETARETVKSLLGSENLTADEISSLTEKKETIETLLNKIDEVGKQISSIKTTLDGYTVDNVTVDDADSIEAAQETIEALLESSNLTEDEKISLNDYLDKSNELLNKLAKDIAIKDINTEAAKYDEKTVTDADKSNIEELIENIDSVMEKYASSLTSEEKESLNATKEKLNGCISKIDSVVGDIFAIGQATNGKTEDNVKSSDKATLEDAKTKTDALLNGTNITEEERDALEETKETITSLLNKIDEVSSEISSIEKAIEGKTTDNVTSSDKTSLEEAKTKAESLINSSNLTAEEKEELEGCQTTINSLLTEIAKDEAIAKVNEAAGKYSESTVKSSDKDDINEVIADIDGMLKDYASSLTDAEKTSLEETKSTLNGYVNKIDEVAKDIASVDSAIKDKTEDNVKSSDKDSLEDAKETIESLLKTPDNLTTEEKTSLETKKATIEDLLNKIDEVGDKISSIKTTLDGYTIDNVTSDDASAIEGQIEAIESLLESESSNLTADEISSLNEYLNKGNGLLSEIAKDEAIKSIKEEAAKYDSSTVTSSDKDNIESLISNIDSVLEKCESSLTSEEKASLNKIKDDLNECLSKIESVTNDLLTIANATNGKTEDNVKSSDKSLLEDAKTKTDALLNGTNLTEEERSALEETKETISSLLEKIGDVSSKIDSIEDAIEGKTTSNVTSSDKASLEETKDKANALLNGDNLTAEEKASLQADVSEISSMLDKIEETASKLAEAKTTLDNLSKETVKSSDKDAIQGAVNTLEELSNSSNLTDSEKTGLDGYITKGEELLTEIAKDEAIASINAEAGKYSESTVKSSDKDAINDVIADIDSALDTYSSSLTASEKAVLEATKESLNGCISKIDEVKDAISSINSSLEGKTEGNVKSSDKTPLEETKKKIDSLLSGDNLTAEEKASLQVKANDISSMLKKIEDVKNAISSISSETNGKTTSNVKSSDKEDLEEAKKEINSLLAGDNLTAEEKASLENELSTVDSLLNKIKEVSDKISSAKETIDGVDQNSATSEDKEKLQDAIDTLEGLSDDNLTSEEKTQIQQEITKANSTIATIDAAEKEYDEVVSEINGLINKGVDDSNEEEAKEIVKKAEELKKSSHISDEQKNELQSLINSLNKKIAENEGPLSLAWYIVVLSITAVVEGLILFFTRKKKNKEKKEDKNVTKMNSVIFPLFGLLALASYPVWQVAVVIALVVVVVGLALWILLSKK